MAEHPTDDSNVAKAAGAGPTLLEAVANTQLEGLAPLEGGPINPAEPFPELDHDLMAAFPQMMAQLRPAAASAAPTVAAASAGAPPPEAATPMDASSSPVVAAEAKTVPPASVVPKTPVIEGKADAHAFPPVPPPVLPKHVITSRILPPPPPPPPVPGAAVSSNREQGCYEAKGASWATSLAFDESSQSAS